MDEKGAPNKTWIKKRSIQEVKAGTEELGGI